jgi:hypothetical protein
MGPVKALFFLEWRSFVNRLKFYSKHKWQMGVLLLIVIAFVASLLTIEGGQGAQFVPTIGNYAGIVISFSIIASICLALVNGLKRLPVTITTQSSYLLFSIPLSSKGMVMYYFWKQFVLQLLVTLVLGYSIVSILGKTYLPMGLFFTWIGLVLLSLWTSSLALLVHAVSKRIYIKSDVVLGVIIAIFGLIFVISGGTINSFWNTIDPQSWWPGNWFYQLIITVLYPETIAPWDIILGLVILNVCTLVIAQVLLPESRDEILKSIYRSQILSGEDGINKMTDPDEAMLKLFGAKQESRIARRFWFPGLSIALIWKEAVTWERLKPKELKFGIFYTVFIGGICGLLYSIWNLPVWLILLLAPLNALGGSKPVFGIFHVLTWQMPGKWSEKVFGVTLLPVIENTVYHFIALLAMIGTILILGGFEGQDGLIILPLILLLIGLNVLTMIVVMFGTLFSIKEIGFFKKGIKVTLLMLHVLPVILVAEYYLWNITVSFVLFSACILLTVFWFKVLDKYLNLKFYID